MKSINFEYFYTELQKNEPWFDQMKLRYFRKDLKDVANQCYIFLLASEQRWDAQDYQDFRKCYQSFLSNAKDKVTAPQLQQTEVVNVEISGPILTGEERDKKISEWLESVKSQKMINPIPKLTRKQIAEEGDWLPKRPPPHPSTTAGELKKFFIHQLYIKHNFDIITKDKLTEWLPEEKWIEENEFELNELWQEELSKKLTLENKGLINTHDMRSEVAQNILDNIPLETKIKVSNEMAFINLITELGYRENKMWTEEEDELLYKLLRLAGEHTQQQMKLFEVNN